MPKPKPLPKPQPTETRNGGLPGLKVQPVQKQRQWQPGLSLGSGCTLVQRCRIHQERGVLAHLPEREPGWVRGKLRRAWANPDADEATRDLEALAPSAGEAQP